MAPVSEIGARGADRIGPLRLDLDATPAVLWSPAPWRDAPELRAVLNDAARLGGDAGGGPVSVAGTGRPGRPMGAAAKAGPDLGELALDLGQIALDIVGVFEPTPFADLANTVISGGRGDWWGAGMSLAGVVPYLGDLAKLGKLGRYAQTVAKAVDLAAGSPAARAALEPALRRIGDALDAIPQGALDRLPAEAREHLLGMKRQVDEFLSRGADDAAARGARIQRLDAPGRRDLDPERVDALSWNHEQRRPDVREGIGGARAEAAMGTRFRPSEVEGVDFFDGDKAISLKGPLVHARTGADIPITDSMVDGLAASVLRGSRTSTAYDVMVVDLMGLSPQQSERLIQAVVDGLGDAAHQIKFLE